MLDVNEARARLLASLTPTPIQSRTVALDNAAGAISAEDVLALVPSPPYRRAVMDGYACRAADLPGPLPVAFEVPAGSGVTQLSSGQCARIFTGAPVPEGADAVVPQENLRGLDGGATLDPSDQAWIRPMGDDIAVGQTLVRAGQRLGPAELGVLASGGHAQVSIQVPLRVGLLTTGDEVQPPGAPLAPGQIHNSNAPSLMALLRGWGVQVTHQHVPDSLESTTGALRDAAVHHDLVLTVGGVSAGDYDWVRPAIESLGRIESYKVKMKPGKPFAFGTIDSTPVCCLPGNPASAFVTSLLFVRPVIRALTGQPTDAMTLPVTAKFETEPAQRRRFLRVRWDGDGIVAHPNQDSGSMTPLVWGTGLAEIPPDTAVSLGDTLVYWPFSELLF